MKLPVLISAITFALSIAGFASEKYWRPGTEYTAPYVDSPWTTDELSTLEYRILYLLDADLSCREALVSLEGDEVPARAILVRSLDSIDEVLETLYAEAAPHLTSTPNPYLLTMMLYHHGRFVNSAIERWEQTIATLEAIDEDATRHVKSILQTKNNAGQAAAG